MEYFIANLISHNPILGTILASMLPIIEARGAIPFSLSSTFFDPPLNPVLSLVFAFIGSAFMTLVLLISLSPIISGLKRTKAFKKLCEKLESKSNKITTKNGLNGKKEFKKYLFLALFTMLPLPLTGYYTACLIASFMSLNKLKSFFAIALGNLICICLMIGLCTFLNAYINYIFYFFVICFIVTVIYYLIDFFAKKKNA